MSGRDQGPTARACVRWLTERRWLATILAGWVVAGSMVLKSTREALARPAITVLALTIEDRGASYDLAQTATDGVVASLVARGFAVIDRARAKQMLDVDLAGQAGLCRGDVFCLVEAAELFGADRLVSGHLSLRAASGSSFHELLLLAVDVPRAKMLATGIFRVLASGDTTVGEMAQAAARRLLTEPDIDVVFKISPPDAVVELYGERVGLPADGRPMRYWSGVYEMTVTREAYLPKRVRVSLGAAHAEQAVVIELEPDPLYVARRPSRDRAAVFSSDGAPSRPLPSLDAGEGFPRPPVPGVSRAPAIRLQTILASSLIAGGLSLGVAGAWLQGRAQGDYNDLSRESRFGAETRPAEVARTIREDARANARFGGVLVVSGVVAVGVGIGWWIVDSNRSSDR